ncbi:Rad1/Rec1/Rad17 [Mycena sp. CBHHK59/15]|nr:Rad1/Rec1/Rad17 [Mycena sp. CBHHK59/15]
MSQTEDSEDLQQLPPVLRASVHDVRHFAALLRGVNFVNRATVTITKTGFVVVVEEARTLLGTAYVFAGVFDEYTYNSELPPAPQNSQNSDTEEEDNAAFEIELNTLLECLNIFGTAGPSTSSMTGGKTGRYKRWKKTGEDSDQDDDEDSRGRGGRGRHSKENDTSSAKGIDQYFSSNKEKGTGMRMTYAGSGYPLTLLIAEDAAGPTTKCEIITYEAEPHLQLPFDPDQMVLKIILKSSWLRDALSELDPSCDKLTFIGNPPPTAATGKRPQLRAGNETPMLRIQAAGTFGSTEMDYPNDREVLETFECTRPVSFSYRFGHISRTLRALQSSSKTSLRIDDEGLMSLQFIMPGIRPKTEQDSDAFIEFRCLALDDEIV